MVHAGCQFPRLQGGRHCLHGSSQGQLSQRKAEWSGVTSHTTSVSVALFGVEKSVKQHTNFNPR